MKLVILAGGYGTRISEETKKKPKPLIKIGTRPIIWHLMKIYSKFNINNFIICQGYKGYMLQDELKKYIKTENWSIKFVNTGLNTMTGGRIKRIEPYTNGESFMLTYGDGLANININTLIKNHISSKSICTVTAVSPPGRFGTLVLDNNNKVSSFEEKKEGKKSLINGGFFVCDNSIFSYIKDDETVFEKTPLENLSLEGKLNAYVHKGFWQPMDTLRDKNQLNSLWSDKKAPWKLWE